MLTSVIIIKNVSILSDGFSVTCLPPVIKVAVVVKSLCMCNLLLSKLHQECRILMKILKPRHRTFPTILVKVAMRHRKDHVMQNCNYFNILLCRESGFLCHDVL